MASFGLIIISFNDNIEQSNQRNWLCFINTLITAPLHGLAPLIKLAMVKKFDKLINDPLIWEPEPSYNFLRDRVIVQSHEQSKLASNINGSNKLLPSAPTELINDFLVEGNFNENLFKSCFVIKSIYSVRLNIMFFLLFAFLFS